MVSFPLRTSHGRAYDSSPSDDGNCWRTRLRGRLVAVRARAAAGDASGGFLHSGALTELHDRVTAFRQGLKETAYVEGDNIVIESGEKA